MKCSILAISTCRYAEVSGDDVREAATPECPLGDDSKRSPHMIEPGGIGRRLVDVEARPLRQPGADLSLRGRPAAYGVSVSAVVDDQMHVVFMW